MRLDSLIHSMKPPNHAGRLVLRARADRFQRGTVMVRSVARFGSALTTARARRISPAVGRSLVAWLDPLCAAAIATVMSVITSAAIVHRNRRMSLTERTSELLFDVPG